MRRIVFKSKIHRATVTDADLHYEGSLTIDAELLDAADILPNEQVHVWDVTSGNRLVTYAIAGPRGSGTVCVNGAGAHLIKKGHIVIIGTFTMMKTRQAKRYRPTVVFVNEWNRIKDGPDYDHLDDGDDGGDGEDGDPTLHHSETQPNDEL